MVRVKTGSLARTKKAAKKSAPKKATKKAKRGSLRPAGSNGTFPSQWHELEELRLKNKRATLATEAMREFIQSRPSNVKKSDLYSYLDDIKEMLEHPE